MGFTVCNNKEKTSDNSDSFQCGDVLRSRAGRVATDRRGIAGTSRKPGPGKETISMPEHIDPRGQDNPSQYMVEDRSSNPEMIRLMIQDTLLTTGMGGPLAEQADPASLHRVLDIGC